MAEPQQLTKKQWLIVLALALTFGGPALYAVEFGVGPGPWLIEFQDQWIGGHSKEVAMAVIMFGEILAVCIPLGILGILVKLVTGKTIVELIYGKREPKSPPYTVHKRF